MNQSTQPDLVERILVSRACQRRSWFNLCSATAELLCCGSRVYRCCSFNLVWIALSVCTIYTWPRWWGRCTYPGPDFLVPGRLCTGHSKLEVFLNDRLLLSMLRLDIILLMRLHVVWICGNIFVSQMGNLLISKQRRCPETHTIKKGVYSFFMLLLARFYVEQRSEYKENKERRQTFFNK